MVAQSSGQNMLGAGIVCRFLKLENNKCRSHVTPTLSGKDKNRTHIESTSEIFSDKLTILCCKKLQAQYEQILYSPTKVCLYCSQNLG